MVACQVANLEDRVQLPAGAHKEREWPRKA